MEEDMMIMMINRHLLDFASVLFLPELSSTFLPQLPYFSLSLVLQLVSGSFLSPFPFLVESTDPHRHVVLPPFEYMPFFPSILPFHRTMIVPPDLTDDH